LTKTFTVDPLTLLKKETKISVRSVDDQRMRPTELEQNKDTLSQGVDMSVVALAAQADFHFFARRLSTLLVCTDLLMRGWFARPATSASPPGSRSIFDSALDAPGNQCMAALARARLLDHGATAFRRRLVSLGLSAIYRCQKTWAQDG